MKANKMLTVLIAGLFMSYSIFATDSASVKSISRMNSFKEGLKPVNQELILYPLSFIGNGLELGTEFILEDNNTLRLSAGYFMSDYRVLANDDGNTFKAFRTEAQYRFYSRDFSASDNFFLGVYGVYKAVSSSEKSTSSDNMTGVTEVKNVSYSSNALSLGAFFGYRIRFFDIFSMDFFLGGGITPINYGDIKSTSSVMLPTNGSVYPRIGCTFGVKI